MAKKNKMLIPIIIVLLVTVIAMVLMIFGKDNYKDVIDKNVYVNGVAVGTMTKAQAKDVLGKKFNEQFKDKKIHMTYEGKSFSISFKSLKAHYDIDTAVEEAFNYNKNGGLISNILRNMGINSSNHNINLKFVADTSIVGKTVKKISRKIDYEPIDAKISFVDNVFKVTNDVNGLKVDTNELSKLIKTEVVPYGEDNVIKIPVTVVEAKVKADMLAKINTQISTFTTSFRTSDAARSGNIKIAAEAVDGAVVLPGEIFSMNKEVGPRVASKGYQEAHVIINGTLTTGLAGGICQATTTIYNAALLANLQIISRRGHGLRVGYVKPGLDATISGDYIDMKFKNTNQYPLYIHTIVKNGTIRAVIYGANEHPGQTVKLESHVLEKINPQSPEYIYDSTLRKGEKIIDSKAVMGMKSISYRKVFQDGKLVKTELLSKDKYKAAREVIRVGTKIN